ncbi:hypothetical protein T440DRAFT_393996 [Plenodomus tracheiphilus IPT5]|uniref:DUF3431 domain containing protein n=1 Tax=Plenodomus tracheiphilus IPT5 TaxID=1408161 RepID=A0A6A7BAI8_9PLEO|nr:hypothetical protein T440DRAFT_393996 [Plenodomus tracheiphilus IPT5]
MPRFSIRNAVIAINILLLTALFLHLKLEIWDKHASVAGERAGDSHVADELFDETQRHAGNARANTANGKGKKELKANTGVKARRTAVVVASQAAENATWLDEYFPDWEKNIYRVDDPHAALTVPKNKGRESMVYLTYIIDNYNSLPDNILFIHPTRYQWHNDDPDYDGVPMLRHFQLPYLESQGYVNIRCAWTLGCPQEIKPYEEEGEHRAAVHAGGVYKTAFEQLFPGVKVPRHVGVSCCAQFAATREKIRERGLDDYKRWRDWVLQTDLKDDISGRVLEYSWHMMFGKPPVHCPRAEDCYCKTFGLCNLKCSEGSCGDRYTLPPFSTLPKGWPYVGWYDEKRERAGPEE